MSVYLLDINILIALHAPAHVSHRRVQDWFHHAGRDGFSTCPITQSGFLRVSAQISAQANVGYLEAKIALEQLTRLPGHVFWSITIGYLQASTLLESRIQGHRQVTDAYLLGLCLSMGGVLVTLARGVFHLAGPEFADSVQLIA